MIQKNIQPNSDSIKKSSKTFYISSLFFPKKIRKDVYSLYTFLRISDDYVDSSPPDYESFSKLKNATINSLSGQQSGIAHIDSFAELINRRKIDHSFVMEYFKSQDIDLFKRSYESYEELCKFVYGVADVIGIFMSYVMCLPENAFDGAKKMGHAMQLVNIIRDISEDETSGKVFLPIDELDKFNLPKIITEEVSNNQNSEFISFIRFQLDRSKSILHESKESISYIPRRLKLSIKIVANIYESIIDEIYKDPTIIFRKKVKPSIFKIILISLKQTIIWMSRI